MHYRIFWYVPFSCFRRDRHVSHHNTNLLMTCHVKLLIYIDSLGHLCYWNHRLQTVVHKMFIDTFNFYWYNYLLFDSWKKLPFKVIFCQVAIYNHWSNISCFYSRQVFTKVSQTKRNCTGVHDAGPISCLSYKKAIALTDNTSRLLFHCNILWHFCSEVIFI